MYILKCTTVTGARNIVWLDPMSREITGGVVTTGSLSRLTFNTLATSHAGTYTCRALVNEMAIYAHKDVSVLSK
jgi:hypothetical protein